MYKTIILFLLLLFLSPANANVEVVIEGVDKKLEEKLLIALAINRQKNNDKLTPASIKALFKRAAAELDAVLRSHGYYHAELIQELQNREAGSQAIFKIDVGQPTLIRELDLSLLGEGKEDKELQKVVNSFPLLEGEQLDHGLYEAGKKNIQNMANRRGYFDAEWRRHELRVDTEKKQADIKLVFDSGVRYRYDLTELPATVILPKLLKKTLTINSGDFYDADQLIKIQQDLQNTNYFEQVEISQDLPDEKMKSISIHVRLTEKKKNSFRAGFGFGTDTGPRLAAAWDSPYLNRRGHRLETDLRVSFVQSSLSSSYLIPYFRDRETELGITSAVSRENTDTSTSNKFQTSLQHLASRWGWNETFSLTYQFEDFSVAETKGTSNLLIPGLSYWTSVSDDPVYTNRGFRLSGDLRGAAKGFISDTSFLQVVVRGKYIFSAGDNGRLISRGDVGATITSSFTNLPSSLRFFAGGDSSIRGFDFDALGPVNAEGEIIGGKYLAVGSIEYEHRVYEKWSVAVFSDFGNAFDDFNGNIEYSVGAGIRWRSPVGLIRVDLATGISAGDNPLRLHIIIGPDL